MNKVKLSEVANVELSSIDKKIVQGERSVKLCNFTDVYYNWAITKSIVDKCMEGSVNESEFSKFALRKGQVAITKDSETRSDIGMSTYISEDFDDVVLAYHCALITPKEGKVNGKYLNALLNDSYGRKYFSNQASGSGQRYTLTKEAIESIKIPLPSMEKQNAIGSFFSNIDRKIELNNRINDNLQQMANAKYMHMFFGKKANAKLGDIITENPKSTIQVGDAKDKKGNIPFFTSGDAILRWSDALVSGRNCYLNTGGNAGVKFYVGNAAYSTDTWCISAPGNLSDYLYMLLESIKPELNQKFFQGTSLKHLQKPLLKDRPIYIPETSELESFNKDVVPWLAMISDNIRESEELTALRDWLLPMLMNGQATIAD